MLPEPTIPKPPAAAPTPPQQLVMTPLFCVPDSDESDKVQHSHDQSGG